jgi:hypothetical protein
MKKISRRQFLYGSAAGLTTCLASQLSSPFGNSEAAFADDIRGKVFKGDAPDKLWQWSREGFLYKKLKRDVGVQCLYKQKAPDRALQGTGWSHPEHQILR